MVCLRSLSLRHILPTVKSESLTIGKQTIGPNHPVWIIAEAGVNHNGNLEWAKKLVDAAVEAGADAVKFQSFKTEHLILKSVPKATYQTQTTSAQESQFEMLKRLELNIEQTQRLFDYCTTKGIQFLTTPFDEWSLDQLDCIPLNAYKIASTDLTNLPFIQRLAKKQKPLLLSTGMSTFSEVEMAVKEIKKHHNNLVVLQCTANYPTPDEDVHLRVLTTYQNTLNCLVGFSDHTPGLGATPYSIPLGAVVVEKHLTLDTSLPGPDHKASLTPSEFKELVHTIRRIETWLGTPIKTITPSEKDTRQKLQKNLVAAMFIPQGTPFKLEHFVGKRTNGEGISPIHYQDLLGKPAPRNFNPDEIITL